MVCLKDYCLISEGRISYNKLYMYKNLKVREKELSFSQNVSAYVGFDGVHRFGTSSHFLGNGLIFVDAMNSH